MKAIIEFGAFFAVGILNHMIGAFFYSKRPDFHKSFTVTESLLGNWGSSISGILVVLLVALNQPDGLASVGIITNRNAVNDKNPALICIGIVSIWYFLAMLAIIRRIVYYFRKITPETKIDLSNPAVTSLFQYQSSLERLAYLSVLPLAVISEELIYRGYLVLMMGSKTQSYVPWIILSVILSVIIHLYQGRSVTKMLYQAAYALCFIALTILTGNIMTPIIAHVYNNILWALGVWKKGNNTTAQPVTHSKGKSFAYSVFIATNLLLLLASLLAVSVDEAVLVLQRDEVMASRSGRHLVDDHPPGGSRLPPRRAPLQFEAVQGAPLN